MQIELIKKLKMKLELHKINLKIEKEISKEKKAKEKQFKILILGTGESGKSTFVKQLRLNDAGSLSLRERNDAIEIIFSNLVICVYIIICQDTHNLHDSDDEDFQQLLEYTKCLFTCLSSREEKEISYYVSSFIRPGETERKLKVLDICEAENFWDLRNLRRYIMMKIWQNQSFTDTLLSLGPVKLPDSALYFLTHFERVLHNNFLPTNKDILRMRKATTGVCDTSIHFQGHFFRIVDLGGQRSERKKWIHCFEDVDSAIFLSSLADYDLSLIEDSSVNRLKESLALFKTVMKTEFFKNRKIFLFLNKLDLFEEKVRNTDLSVCFQDYEGKYCDKNDAKKFILEKFLENGNGSTIFVHMMNATDTSSVKTVFSAVKESIFTANLVESLKNDLF